MSVANRNIVILDHGAGNVASLANAFKKLGAQAKLSTDPDDILNAEGLVLPGVGAFDTVAKNIEDLGSARWIGRRIAGGRPVLGICVGHQYLFDSSTESKNGLEGMGEWPGTVERLPSAVLPNIGWSRVTPPKGSQLFAGIEDEHFYFVHSYAVQKWEFDQTVEAMFPPQVTWSHYDTEFIAAIENGPLMGTQFHPEKSGDVGLQLLRNWMGTF